MSVELWEYWNSEGTPNYPQEKVVQFCLRNFSAAKRPQTQALDLGCGSGVNTGFLAAEGFVVTGVDISATGIKNTQAMLTARGLAARLAVSSADRVDFPDASFGLVICVGVLDAAGPALAPGAVAEAARVLQPGGKGIFIFASDLDLRVRGENEFRLHGFTRSEVDRMFATGFSRVWIDRYITTFEGGRYEANDWLVTVEK